MDVKEWAKIQETLLKSQLRAVRESLNFLLRPLIRKNQASLIKSSGLKKT